MVKGSRSGNLGATISTEHHHLISGVLPALGGDDEGANPHELLEAALACCTIITVQMYANRKGWKLASTDVSVDITNEGLDGTSMVRTVTFNGDLSDDERKRLLDIANKCPIHRLLSGKISIETRLAAG